MDEKLNHSDLSTQLAEKSRISASKSDIFTKNFFELLIEGLEKEGIVKINNLGTFKMVDVASRNSVNVNTGEKIEIKGHKKITFTSTDTLKEKVNQPFAMFEPVEVSDDYIDEDIEEVEASTDVAESEKEVEERADNTPVESGTDAEQTTKENTDIADEDKTADNAGISDEATDEDDKASDDNPVEPDESSEVENIESKEETKEEINKEDALTGNDVVKTDKSFKKIYIILPLILLSIGATAYLFFAENSSDSSNTTACKNETASVLPLDTVVKDVAKIDTIKPEEPKKREFVLIEELKQRKLSDISISDTTDYKADGTMAVHRVGLDETLVKISYIYYNDKRFWPYIVNYNKMKNFNSLEIGMEILIPNLEPVK